MSKRSESATQEVYPRKGAISTPEPRSLISFSMDEGWYGVDLGYVEGVVRVQNIKITDIPGVPPYIMGITNVRGQILSVIHLRRLLELPDRRQGPSDPCLIVVSHQGVETSLYVDDVNDVVALPPVESRPDQSAFIEGSVQIDGKMLVLIDIERLMTSERMQVGSR